MGYTLKRGVAIVVTAEIEILLYVASLVFDDIGKSPLVVTSGVDGPHRVDSLHYKFRAVDIRSKDIDPIHLRYVVDDLKSKYREKGIPADVILEQDHIHIEWDERRKT